MGEEKTIVVIGAGVLGLTTALSIQQQVGRSHRILIVARDFPGSTSVNYASPWAGAHYRPVPGHSSQIAAESQWAKRTYETFKKIAVDEPAAGVTFLEGIEHFEQPLPAYLDAVRNQDSPYAHVDGLRELSREELPPDVKFGIRYWTYCVNSPVYCAYLLRKFVLKGGKTKEFTLVNLMEAFHLASNVVLVVNCSGLGFSDPQSYIIRGQTCLVRNACSVTLTRQNSDGSWSFCIPRPLEGGTIIGGTKEINDWNPDAVLETRTKLLQDAAKWFPFAEGRHEDFDVICDIVGRRPAREGGVRLELEQIGTGRNSSGQGAGEVVTGTDMKKFVLHVYGVGGRGYELSWGIAEEATTSLVRLLSLQAKPSL